MRLAKRERLFIAVGSIITFSLLFYYLLIAPLLKKDKHLSLLIANEVRTLAELIKLREHYLKQKDMIVAIDATLTKQPDFAILSFLEGGAEQIGIKGYIKNMKPSKKTISNTYEESSVELKLEGINLRQLIEYMYYIENTKSKKVLTIERMRINKRFKEPHTLDAVFNVSSFNRGEKTGITGSYW